jgi:hypothetical protein
LPDGYAVKKGDMVSYQPYPMGRMKFLWGDDAEEFRPERWLDDDGVFVPESPFKFTAFQVKSLFYFFFWIKEIPILLNMSILLYSSSLLYHQSEPGLLFNVYRRVLESA